VTFRDRHAAGRQLGEYLAYLRDERPVVLALPRGGVPVAAEVAAALGAPLDVIVVRKLGLPFQPELGFGAIGEGGVRLLDTDLIRRAGLSEQDVATVEHQERIELARRVRRYRGDRPPTPIGGRTVVIVDDGLATGGTAGAALASCCAAAISSTPFAYALWKSGGTLGNLPSCGSAPAMDFSDSVILSPKDSRN